jgi:drug/metabolite transporter (DMT)-like permease
VALATLGVLLAITLWGISFVATKSVLREIPPVTLVFTRFAIGVLFLTTVLLWRKEPLLPPRHSWRTVALLGFLGVFFHQVVQSYALTLTSATHTGWLIGLTPIWSAVLAALFLSERFGAMKAGGLALGFLGAAVIVSRRGSASGVADHATVTGDLLVLATTVNWAVYTILGRKALAKLGAASLTAGAMLAGWLMLLPLFVALEGWRDWSALTPHGWGGVLFLGIGCSGLGYLLWCAGLSRLPASRVAAFLYLEPLVTLVAAMIVLGEPLDLATIAGGLCVLAGVLVIQRAG